MRRVLVTGAGGYIGRWTLAPLRAAGFEVVAAGRADGDFLTPGVPEALVAKARPTHLLHLAWTTAHGRFWSDPANPAWCEASLALLHAFAEAGGERAVVAGSCAELILGEDRQPHTAYGRAKRDLAERGGAILDAAGIGHAHARLFFSYGPGEHPDRLVPAVIRPLLRGERAALTPGTQVRDFLHVRDVAGALAHLVSRHAQGPLDLGSGQPLTIATVAQTIGRLLGRPDLVGIGDLPLRPGDPPHLVAETDALHTTGFRPTLTLEAGLMDVIDWWRQAE